LNLKPWAVEPPHKKSADSIGVFLNARLQELPEAAKIAALTVETGGVEPPCNDATDGPSTGVV